MKNKFLKLCSTLLVLALLVNMLPMSIFAEELNHSLTADSEAVLQPEAAEPAEVVAELTEKRTQYTKEFLLSNGLHMATVYADPVHYEKDGQWAEIDNTLKITRNGTVTNTAGVWNVRFPQQLDGGSVTIEKDGYTLSFAMDGELRSSGELMTAAMGTETAEQLAVGQLQTSTAAVQPTDTEALRSAYQHEEAAPEKLYSQLRYDGVYQNTDILYDLQANTVKESIVMGAYSSTLRGYRYTLNVRQLLPVLSDDGEITFFAPDRETVVMVMPAPYLLDAASEFNDDIQVRLTGKGSAYTLTYLLPTQWLAAENRAWPVILDPVVQADLDADNILDRTVAKNKNHSYTWSILDAGYSTTRGKIRSYLQFVNLPTITSSDVVVMAEFSLYKVETSATSYPVEIHKVTDSEPWDSQNITWDDQPDFSEKVEDYQDVRKAGWYNWNITDLVRDWYTTGNNGLMLKMSDAIENGNTSIYRQFHSSDAGSSYRPHLFIYFRNNNGLESYWPYTSGSAGRAGTGHVNTFTGNLTWIRQDMGFGGNLMPVTIQHVYNANDVIIPDDDNNSNDSGSNSFGMGLGWRTNYNQLVYKWNQNSNYYVWEDGDGTDHYFEKVSGSTYKDEDGLELTLTVNSNSDTARYTITTKTGETSVFDKNGRLVKLVNNQDEPSEVNITYTSSTAKQINTITDGAGRTYKFTYAAGQVQNLTYYGSAETFTEETKIARVKYWFDGWKLVSITEMDGSSSRYTYNAKGFLTSAKDIDGYQLSYTYNVPKDIQPYRVMSVSERDTVKNADGGTLTFEYGHNQTTLTDHNGNKETLQFNDWGNVVAVQDDEGHAQYAAYARNNSADTAGKANQLRLSSKLQNTVGNIMRYGGFETGNDWKRNASATNPDSAAISRTTEQAHTGSYSLKVISQVFSGNNGAYSPTFTAQPNETITYSLYVLIPQGTARMKLSHRTASGSTGYTNEVTALASDRWQKVQIPYTNNTGEVVTMRAFFLAREVGSYYIDDIQIEKAATASRYNLVENGDFRYDGGWEPSGTDAPGLRTTVTDGAAPQLENTVYQITGDTATSKEISQRLEISGSVNDTFVLSGWAKGDSVPLKVRLAGSTEYTDGGRFFGLKATFHNADETTTERTVSFNPDTQNTWQYAATPVVADKDYTAITVSVIYAKNLNTVCFDGIQLYKEEFGSSYTYDEDGNLISVVDLQKKNTTYEYDDNTGDLIKILEDNKAKMRYEYDERHNVIKAVTQKQNENGETVDGIAYEFAYDEWGNNTQVTIVGKKPANGEAVTIRSTADYTENGNYLEISTNALGKATRYGYNIDTGVLEWVQYPGETEATRTEFEYDDMYRQAMAACTTDTGLALSAEYAYEDDYLTTIRTPTTIYGFTYREFGLQESIKVGDQELATYDYTEDQNRYLALHTYGNGDYISYSYDTKGRPIQVVHTDVAEPVEESTEEPAAEPTVVGDFTVKYHYDNDGNLASVEDGATGNTITHYYDLLGRPMKSVETGTDYTHSVEYHYNGENNLEKLIETINGTERTTAYAYDSENRVTSVTTDGVTVTYTYDDFGRVTEQVTKNGETVILTEAFGYATRAGKDENGTAVTLTSGQIATYTTVAGDYSVTYSYDYDDNGNITSVTSGGKTTSYVYDSANQLIRENNEAGDYTHTWTYDNAGNITSRKKYRYTTAESLSGLTPAGGGSYVYGNDDWGDLLTEYNGNYIDYDNIGNPVFDGDWEYAWEHGRQLSSMSHGNSGWIFTYDAGGMRTGRSDGDTTYQYIYTGSQLTQMKKGDETLTFTYDASGIPLTVTYNGTKYYYATNLQGDVVAILDASGTTVASYTYDAWGKCLNSYTSGIGFLNPLRYRGYVCDQETKLYYLQSRYYDPEVGRFINADIFVSTGQGFIGNNMFAYCNNNPVNSLDSFGSRPFSILERFGDKSISIFPKKDRKLSKQNNNLEEQNDTSAKISEFSAVERINNHIYYTNEADRIIREKQIEFLKEIAVAVWDAFERGFSLQQDAHNLETQLMVSNFSSTDRTKKTLNVVGAELSFIGFVPGFSCFGAVGSFLLILAALLDAAE